MRKYKKKQILEQQEKQKVFLFHRQNAFSYPDIKKKHKKQLDLDIKRVGEVEILKREIVETADNLSILWNSKNISKEAKLSMALVLKVLQSTQYKTSKLKRHKDVTIILNGLIRKEALKSFEGFDKRINFQLCPETIRKAFKYLKKLGFLNYDVTKLRAKRVEGIRSVRRASLTPLGLKFVHFIIREGFSFNRIMSLGHYLKNMTKNLRERRDYILNLLLAPAGKAGGLALYKLRCLYKQLIGGLGWKEDYTLYKDAVNRYVIPPPAT